MGLPAMASGTIATADEGYGCDALTKPDMLHTRTQSHDLTAELVTDDAVLGQLLAFAGTHLQIAAADTCPAHPDQHFSSLRRRIRPFLDDQGLAGALEYRCFHFRCPPD